jgi:hypothetical protein
MSEGRDRHGASRARHPVAKREKIRYQRGEALDLWQRVSGMVEYWFRPKQRGIGAGVPTHWKGWALFGGYVGSILMVPTAFELYLGYPGTVLLRVLGVIAVSIPFLTIAWRKTEGGWRWRRGEEDDVDDETPA